jgi:5-hydroxyisourate hydrolase-like protein (transthyretin family)
LATPIITALYALAGNHTDPLSVYHNVTTRSSSFVDITSGANGSCASVLCHAAAGWDGPTGIGTPAGLTGLTTTGQPTEPLARPKTAAALRVSGSYPATLSYRLVDATTGSPVSGARVRIQATADGRTTTIGTVRTSSAGTLSYRVRPHGPTSYRIQYDGDDVHAATSSTSVSVQVFAPHVTLRRVARGVQVRAIAPWGAGAGHLRVTLQARTGKHWHPVRKTLTNVRGIATVKVPRGATYRATYGGGEWRAGHTASVR